MAPDWTWARTISTWAKFEPVSRFDMAHIARAFGVDRRLGAAGSGRVAMPAPALQMSAGSSERCPWGYQPRKYKEKQWGNWRGNIIIYTQFG